MQVAKPQNRKDRFIRGVARSAEAILSDLEQNPHLPDGMHYFINIMRDVFVNNQCPKNLMGRNKKLIGTYCMMVPEEIIYAAGAIPVRLSGGSYETSCAGDELVPRDTCPVVKASIGSAAMGTPALYDFCEVVIIPTTCDAKRKMGEEISKFKTVWVLEVPHIKDSEDAKRQWRQQVYALKNKLEEYTGNRWKKHKIRSKHLEDAIKMMGQAQYQARRLREIRMSPETAISGSAAMLAINAYCYDTADAWTKAMTALNDELTQRRRKGFLVHGENMPRILLAGCPSAFPNWKIPTLIEEMGALIATDESCLGDRYLYDPVGKTEKSMTDMMTAVAARYLMPCVCPSFIPNADRLYRLGQMIDVFNIDGLIYHVLKGCVSYDFELNRVESLMKEKNVPVLRIETDYNPEDIEQLRTRCEAFVEMLSARKKQKAA